jgi:hypothetical protein
MQRLNQAVREANAEVNGKSLANGLLRHGYYGSWRPSWTAYGTIVVNVVDSAPTT